MPNDERNKMDEKEITSVDYPCECGHMHVQHYAFKGYCKAILTMETLPDGGIKTTNCPCMKYTKAAKLPAVEDRSTGDPVYDGIRQQLEAAQAKVQELQERLKYATHFFDSPASFSNEEFAAVAEKVYGDGTKYTGKCPHLDERCTAEAKVEELQDQLKFWSKPKKATP